MARQNVISVGMAGIILVGLGTTLRFVIPMFGGTDTLDSRTKLHDVGAWFLVPIVSVSTIVGGLFCLYSTAISPSKVGRRAGVFGLALLMVHIIDIALAMHLNQRTQAMVRSLQAAVILWAVFLLMQIDFFVTNRRSNNSSPPPAPLSRSSRIILTIAGILLLLTCALSGLAYIAVSQRTNTPLEELLVSFRGAWIMVLFLTATALLARQSLGIVLVNAAVVLSVWTSISFIPLVSVVVFNIVAGGSVELLIVRIATVASNGLLAAFVSWKLWPAVVATWRPVIRPAKESREVPCASCGGTGGAGANCLKCNGTGRLTIMVPALPAGPPTVLDGERV